MSHTRITLRGMLRSDALSARIHALSSKLEEHHPEVLDCRVAVEALGRHQRQGRRYQVQVNVWVKGREVVSNHHDNEDVYIAVRDAFDAVTRQVEGARH